ncbi:hypothetical protein S7711_11434 [Stachybotrys chartarum IBT 7711]|uniref:Uncharacterized protein n=1 Tax=Stachybotrys chartarum (strain CBS 109288 / IBT 7711) TaxID=1280523 RepID=A0A084BBW6_STACB|nr:hypothetical protein S7711_11434 [Stachybotrys chartarum IBT 7711]
MASISLDNQIFFNSRWTDPKIKSHKSRRLSEDAHQSPPKRLQVSPIDTILISSDDESDCDDSASVQSNMSLPRIDQLLAARNDDGTLTGNADTDRNTETTNSAASSSNPTQSSPVNGPGLGGPTPANQHDDSTTSQYSTSPYSQALAEPISPPGGPLQPSEEMPSLPAGSSLPQAGSVVLTPEADTSAEANEDLSLTFFTGSGPSPSPECVSTRCSPRLEDESPDNTGLCNPSASGSPNKSDDSGCQLQSVRERLRQRTATVRYASCGTSSPGIHSEDGDEDEYRGMRRRIVGYHLNDAHDDSYQPHDSENDRDEDIGQPPQRHYHKSHPLDASEAGIDTESNHICSPPRKRRKFSLVNRPTVLRRSTRQKSRLGDGALPSPSSCQDFNNEERNTDPPTAKFEEWPLKQATLKRIIVNDSELAK